MAMKKLFLFSLLLIFAVLVSVVFADEEDDFVNALRQKREKEQKFSGKQGITEAEYRKIQQEVQQERAERFRQLINSCSNLNNEFASEIASEVIHGRYITALELCRKQEKSVNVCRQKIQEIKERWKAKCQNISGQVLIDYYYAEATDIVYKTLNYLRSMRAQVGVYGPYAGAALSGASAAISQMYPGSQFSLITGTGKIATEAGDIYFQGWNFVEFDMRDEGGLIVQVFPNKLNYTNGKYNIAFYFDPNTNHWEVVEVNLTFDAQTEKLLMSLGQGARVLDKEIIYMMDEFLHNTVFGLDLYVTSQKLLLKNDARRKIIENLFEYYAYDAYLKKVVADEARLKQQEEEQKTKKREKNKGTRK
jgi:hypothetical protein